MTLEEEERLLYLIRHGTNEEIVVFAFDLSRTVPWASHFATAHELGASEALILLRRMLRCEPPPVWWRPGG